MQRVQAVLYEPEYEALLAMAARERRDPRDQVALFVREGLERNGVKLPDVWQQKEQSQSQSEERQKEVSKLIT